MVEPVGSTGRSAGVQPCCVRRGARAAMTLHITTFDVAFREDDSSSRTPSVHHVMKWYQSRT
eukprot:7255504-Prymnesium_polylepis.1